MSRPWSAAASQARRRFGRGRAQVVSDSPMSMLDHFGELRRVLIVSLVAWAIGSIIAFIGTQFFLGILLHPLLVTLKGSHALTTTAIFTSPTEGVSIPLKLAALVGAILALPVISTQVWSFVVPALRPAERRFALPFVVASLVLFAIGGAFAYFVMPIGLHFLITFLGPDARYLPDINSYFSFFLLLIIVFGITFELPVVIVMLGGLGIVSSRQLRLKRKAIWLGIVLAALVVTPGSDPYTPTALAIPLVLLFEGSVVILDKIMHK